jgi:hypothetical protein
MPRRAPGLRCLAAPRLRFCVPTLRDPDAHACTAPLEGSERVGGYRTRPRHTPEASYGSWACEVDPSVRIAVASVVDRALRPKPAHGCLPHAPKDPTLASSTWHLHLPHAPKDPTLASSTWHLHLPHAPKDPTLASSARHHTCHMPRRIRRWPHQPGTYTCHIPRKDPTLRAPWRPQRRILWGVGGQDGGSGWVWVVRMGGLGGLGRSGWGRSGGLGSRCVVIGVPVGRAQAASTWRVHPQDEFRPTERRFDVAMLAA